MKAKKLEPVGRIQLAIMIKVIDEKTKFETFKVKDYLYHKKVTEFKYIAQ